MATTVPGYRDVVRPGLTYVDDTRPDNEPERKRSDHALQSTPLTTRQKLVLAACCMSSCILHIGMSSIPLLLPPEIIEKKIPYEYCGLIFSVFAISIVIFEPLQAKILPYLGTKKTFCYSSLLGGICYTCFAMLDFANTTGSFVAPAMVIRFIEGLYYAALINASNVIVCLEFSDRASFAFGILEGFVGVGFTLGPLLGGALFAAGGFLAPFLFIGLSLLATSLFGYFALEQITGLDLEPKHRERRRLIRDPVFIAVSVLVFSMGIVWGIFETCLEPYLATYDTGAVVEGAIFAIAYFAYAVGSPFWGYIFRRFDIDYRWVLIGPIIVGLVWMILGPIPALSRLWTSKLWLDAICLFVLNFFVAFVFVFSYDTMLKRAIFCGLEENVATYALIVAAFFTSIYIGEAIGPVIGGYVYSQLNFQIVSVVASSLSFCLTLVGALIMLLNWQGYGYRIREKLHEKFPSKFNPPASVQTDESSPLVSINGDDVENIFQPPMGTARLNSSNSIRSYGSNNGDGELGGRRHRTISNSSGRSAPPAAAAH